jgi:fucose permease
LRWQFGLSFLAFVLIGASDGATGVLLPSLGSYYHVDKATLSLLFLLMSGGYLAAALGSGALVQRLGQQHFLMLGTALYAAGALVIALRPPFPLYLGTLLFFGFGFGVIDAGLNA